MKFIVIALLIAIVASLGSGLYYLSRKDHDPVRVLKALKMRLLLSFVLVLFLVVSYYFGWITA